MDSLNSILINRNFDEPPESAAIKRYISDNFRTDVSIMVRDRDIVISVPNASLASTLRLQTPRIKKACETDKRLIIRIG